MPRRSKRPPTTTTVADDIKQKRAFATRGEEASVGLLLTADVVRRYGEKMLAPYGITQQQYNVLRILRGSRPDGLPTLEIAARMIEKAPGITRLLDRLERKGLVLRERCPGDRRQVICRITPKGLDLLVSLDSAIRKAVEPIKRLSQRDLKHLIRLLDSVRRAYR